MCCRCHSQIALVLVTPAYQVWQTIFPIQMRVCNTYCKCNQIEGAQNSYAADRSMHVFDCRLASVPSARCILAPIQQLLMARPAWCDAVRINVMQRLAIHCQVC